MAHFRASLDVARPSDEVFAYLADFTRTAEWDPGVVSAERLDGGPVSVDSRFRVVARFLGREVPLVYRVVQLEPPSRLVLEAETPTLRSLDTITCEKTARGTRLTYDAQLVLPGLLYLADLPLHLAFQWIGRRALAGLGAALATDAR